VDPGKARFGDLRSAFLWTFPVRPPGPGLLSRRSPLKDSLRAFQLTSTGGWQVLACAIDKELDHTDPGSKAFGRYAFARHRMRNVLSRPRKG